jgi:hypothetical protein
MAENRVAAQTGAALRGAYSAGRLRGPRQESTVTRIAGAPIRVTSTSQDDKKVTRIADGRIRVTKRHTQPALPSPRSLTDLEA